MPSRPRLKPARKRKSRRRSMTKTGSMPWSALLPNVTRPTPGAKTKSASSRIAEGQPRMPRAKSKRKSSASAKRRKTLFASKRQPKESR